MDKLMKHQEITTKNQEASMKNMARQIGQISKQLATERPLSSLQSDTVPNPKEECKAIKLRSGKILVKNEEATKKPKDNDKKQVKKEANDEETFKKLEINTPLAEALAQMPLYARFLKELINKKRSWQENETILLTEECRALIQKGLPPKLEDPGSFLLPCAIGSMTMNKAMCDLGASINLMPSSLVKKLCIEEVKPVQMSLELVDKSVICPRGVIENLLVKVDKFIFPADFVILDSDEDEGDSIILGRPFLATARAIIDVERRELTLRMHDESITLNVFPETQLIDEKKDCMETKKENLQWKEGINRTISSYLPKQDIENTTGEKEKETVQNNEEIQEDMDVSIIKEKSPKVKPTELMLENELELMRKVSIVIEYLLLTLTL
ncbi:uncharacterized protein LOC107620698 [Arachis ipaensis]|uniref:uncharacterized protein LOC107620698 n=1 Tax=Arachis ipaensis TaxID=130454 RepID=UPI0007AF3970|nr:uncharacterized protein LOC107620698 [Arachis ipaensis]